MISGVFSLIEPVDHAIGHNHVIAMIFFVQSIGFIFKILMYKKLSVKKSIHNHKKDCR